MKNFIKRLLMIFTFILVIGFFLITQPLLFNSKISIFSSNITKIDEKVLEYHVRNLSSSERFTDKGLQKASDYILRILKANGIDKDNIEIQKYSIGEREYRNIIVHYKKSDKLKVLGGPKYVIGAHYDSHKELPAADDNASGVAGLLEIARILKKQELGNKNIDLVFYSTEEMPHFRTQNMGSYQHAKENKDIKLAIILEMIGYFSEEEGSQKFPIGAMQYLYGDSGNFIALVSNFDNISSVRKMKGYFSAFLKQNKIIGVKSINAPSSIPGIDFSDHQSYWKFNIPAIMISDTAFYRNKNYHTDKDTYEKLNYKKMKEVVDGVVVSVLSL